MNTLDEITPLVITYNEADNISRCLERLRWARRVVILDSGSTDETLSIARNYSNVEIAQRPFDNFAQQCNFGLTLINTKWVLSMDCDYVLGEGFEQEAVKLIQTGLYSGYKAHFQYCIHGRCLSATLYPPRCVLYRQAAACYVNEGHGHLVTISGSIGKLCTMIAHDDRKPLARWFTAQLTYAEREAVFLDTAIRSELHRIDRLRSLGWLLPFIVPMYCLFIKGLWRDGLSGWNYTLQRWLAECIIALALVNRRCQIRIHKKSDV